MVGGNGCPGPPLHRAKSARRSQTQTMDLILRRRHAKEFLTNLISHTKLPLKGLDS